MGHSVEYALTRANKALKKGANTEAEKIFKSVLEVFPGNKRAQEGIAFIKKSEQTTAQSALHTPAPAPSAQYEADLSLVKQYYEAEQHEAVIAEAAKLLQSFPENAYLWNYKGAAHGKAGQLDEALSCFEKVKELAPAKESANNNIGSVWREKGEHLIAESYFRAALQENPKFFDAQKNLGAILHKLERHDQAITEFNKALSLKPNDTEILNAIGTVYSQMNRKDDALATYKKVLEINPNYKQVLNNMGNIYLGQKKFDNAVASYEKALEVDPNYSDAMNNLANALKEMEYLDEAIYYYEQAIEAPNARVELYSNYGVALKDRGYFDRAMEMLDLALEKKPEYPDAEWNKALVYLSNGNFAKGWDAYEWRWQSTNFDSKHLLSSKPKWSGAKERVLIWPEQGLGDQIMFSTLFAEFAEKCAVAIFQVDPRLLPLFRRTYPEYYFIPSDKALAENEYDSHIPMGSMPKYLRRSAENFSTAQAKPLIVDSDAKDKIRQAFRLGDRKLVGISWKSKNADTGLRRSLELEEIMKTFAGKDVDFVSLQYGDTQEDIKKLYDATGIAIKTVDQIDTFTDIDKLASLIACCDEVVTIDNSTVHLAAAIGVRTHLLLPFVCDWRWFAHQHGSLWYRDLNVYKRDEIQSWSDILPQINAALHV